MKELNKIYPLHEVVRVLARYGTFTKPATKATELTLLQYAQVYYEKYYPEDKCTKQQVDAGGPFRVDECSIRADGDL